MKNRYSIRFEIGILLEKLKILKVGRRDPGCFPLRYRNPELLLYVPSRQPFHLFRFTPEFKI